MPSLYRCRASRHELRTQFACEVPQGLTWRSLARPRTQALVIRRKGDKRVAELMHWGMPAPDCVRKFLWTEIDPFSELAFGGNREPPMRGLIILDCFALADGAKGKRTRSWFGLWDESLFAWAGLWRHFEGIGNCFIGAVTRSNPLVARVGRLMPVILRQADHEPWLYGNRKDVLRLWRRPLPDEMMWLERTDELWTSGVSIHEIEAERAFAKQIELRARPGRTDRT